MGAGYVLSCKNGCKTEGSMSRVSVGCGLSYPHVCRETYRAIRKGDLGKEARRAMRWMWRPAIFNERAIFVCKSCGKWGNHAHIGICRLKPGMKEWKGTSIDRERQNQVKVNAKALCGPEPDRYDVVWESKYVCNYCGGETEPKKVSDLRCPTCSGAMNAKLEICWD